MLVIQYVLIIVTCTQQPWAMATNFTSKREIVQKPKSPRLHNLGKRLASVGGSSTTTSHEFSFKNFVSYAKSIYKKSKVFTRRQFILENINKRGFFVTHLTDFHKTDVITPWEKENGEFPKFEVNCRILDKLEHSVRRHHSTPEEEKKLQRKKVELLNKIKRTEMMDDNDKAFALDWEKDAEEIQTLVQKNFLNGVPDGVTEKLFNSLIPQDFDDAKQFMIRYFDKNGKTQRSICTEFSEHFFQPMKIISVGDLDSHIDCYESIYHCKSERKKLLEVVTCKEDLSGYLIYFRVAIAKVENIKDPKSPLKVTHFIAFDQIRKNQQSQKFDKIAQVAISFSGTYIKQAGEVFQFNLDTSSLKENRGKGQGIAGLFHQGKGKGLLSGV